MKNNKKRIETLRKEEKIKEYKNRGINETIADFKIRLSNPLGLTPYYELQKKVLSSLKRQIKKDLKSMTTHEELVAYISKFNFGSSSAVMNKMSDISDIDKKDNKNILSHIQRIDDIKALLRSASKQSLEDKEKIGAEITLPNRNGKYETYTAYGVLGVSLPKRYETGSWSIKRRKMKSTKLMNLEQVLSRVFYFNTLEKYIVSNVNLYYTLAINDELSKKGKKEIDTLFEDIPDLESILEKMDFNDEWKKELLENEDLQEAVIPDVSLVENIKNNKLTVFKKDYIRLMLPEFLQTTNNVELKVDRDMSAYTSYAKTFETKKHINKETMEAMKNNYFLENYGYVEIDNLVDLKKFRELSEEFKGLKRKIYIPATANHSFRIKRIGHYRANGIYFPLMNATVISVEAPSSYIHELGHQLDYTLKKGRFPLSESFKFRRIIDKYRELVIHGVNELPFDDPFYKQWTGGSKANADYYMQPTEVFARSYELYITHVLGIETSFAKKSYDGLPIYPLQDEYLEMIADYFDDLFSFFEPAITNETTSVADVIVLEPETIDIEKYTDVEQLSLF